MEPKCVVTFPQAGNSGGINCYLLIISLKLAPKLLNQKDITQAPIGCKTLPMLPSSWRWQHFFPDIAGCISIWKKNIQAKTAYLSSVTSASI